MSGIDISATNQFIADRHSGNLAEIEAGNLADITLDGIRELSEIADDADKQARLTAFNADLVDKKLSYAIEVLATLDIKPEDPEHTLFEGTLQSVMEARTSHANFILINLIRSVHVSNDSIVQYCVNTNPLSPSLSDVKRTRDAIKAYLQNGPSQAYLSWTDGIAEAAVKVSEMDAGELVDRTIYQNKVALELDEVESQDGEFTLEQAVSLAEIGLFSTSGYEGMITEESRSQTVDFAAATLALLRQIPHWKTKPGYAARVEALAFSFDKLRYVAEGTRSSQIQFEAAARTAQKERKAKEAAAQAQLVGSATVAEVIEEPIIDLEAYEVAKQLAVLVNPKKDEVKKQLAETSKRIDQGDNDPLIQLPPCPEGAQGQVKKLLFTIAGSKNPDQVITLVRATAARNIEYVADEAVKTTIEACQWLQSNYAALAHLRYTYRNHTEGVMVREVKNRFQAFAGAQETATTNTQ